MFGLNEFGFIPKKSRGKCQVRHVYLAGTHIILNNYVNIKKILAQYQ